MPQVADYSWDRPDPAKLKAAGFVGVVRYAPGRDSAVHITKAEADQLKAAGLKVAIVIQPGKTFTLGGFDVGVAEARRSLELTRAAGLPDGDVFVAVDFDATGGPPPHTAAELAQLEQVAQTFEGAASVLGREHVRPYGGFYALSWLYARLPWLGRGWQPARAWSLDPAGVPQLHPTAALRQNAQTTFDGAAIDPNDVLDPDWGPRTQGGPMYLTDLADVLRKAGLKVVEIPGWKTRGRPGSFAPIGVLCHHTGSANTGLSKEYGYCNWMATVGRDDLPAPLAQLGLGRDGTYYVLAAGRANHAGRCKPIAGLQAYSGRDYGDGNAQLVGIEALNSGSEGWTPEQYAAYVRGCAALNAAYGFPVKRTLAHRETSLSGKPDPGGINMTTFRSQVAAVDLNTLEEDMPTVSEIWAATVGGASDPHTVATALVRAERDAALALRAATEANVNLAALTEAVKVLSTSVGVDPSVIADVVDKAVRDRLAAVKIDLVVSDGTVA